MARIIILVKNNNYKYTPSDRTELVNTVRRNLRDYDYNIKLVDVRVASYHVEFDLLVDEDSVDINGIKKLLENHVGEVLEVRRILEYEEADEELFRKALDLFNKERFWEAHEALEPLWRKAAGDEKETLHGLILIAAAFVNYQKNKMDRAFAVFERALARLSKAEDVYRGIDIAGVRNEVKSMLDSRVIRPFRLSAELDK